MIKDDLVHVIKRGNDLTLCGDKTERKRFKWIHEFEAYTKKLLINHKLDMPTCPICLEILKREGIEIINNYEHRS